MTKKQYESSENARDILTKKVSELMEKLDSTNIQLSELCKERDSLQKSLDNIRSDKQIAERGKAELNSIVDSLNLDYEKLQNANNKIQKMADNIDEDKKFLELELQRNIKDKEIIEMNLRYAFFYIIILQNTEILCFWNCILYFSLIFLPSRTYIRKRVSF